jgi:hypothetical protein
VSDHPTEVMSLDELMDLAATESGASETATMPITPPAPPPLNPVAVRPAPRPLPRPQPVRSEPDLRERIMTDARQAYTAGVARSRDWLRTGDNGLITATLLVTLLLLLVVAAL